MDANGTAQRRFFSMLSSKKEDGIMSFAFPGQPKKERIACASQKFLNRAFSDVGFEFIIENGRVKIRKPITPSGETPPTRR